MNEFTDILTVYDKNLGVYDLYFDDNGRFLKTSNLSMAVRLSIFAEARALDSEVLIEEDRRGWWGNETFNTKSDTGSKLWLVSQEKAVTQTRNLTIAYINQSLQWLYEEGFADKIELIYSDIINNEFFCTLKIIKNGSELVNMNLKFYQGIKEDFNIKI